MKAFFLPTVFAALFAHTKSAIELPPPAPGFTWQEIPELKAAFLRPNGWFFKREESKGTLAYFITKENIEVAGEFQTGLTINVFRLKTESAVERGKNTIDQLANRKHGEKWAKEVGPFKEFGCLTRDTDASGTRVSDTHGRQPQNEYAVFAYFREPPSLLGRRLEDWQADYGHAGNR